MLKNKHIVIGVTGGIAAYKIPFLVRELKKKGAQVRVVMTEAAKEFVAPLTLSTLSEEEVIVGIFPKATSHRIDARTWHIHLAQWSDVMLIAPATANVIAKLAQGYADDAVTTLALALRCPLVVSPAMDVDMWEHPTTENNVTKLREIGYVVLPPEKGELASGLVGPGRLPELVVIIDAIDDVLKNVHRDLQGKKILVTAGPTYEAVDPVRFIANRSSGKMGFAIANAAAQRGADVALVTGRVHLPTPRNVKRIDVESAEEMHRAVMKYRKKADAIIMAAAVADFTPAKPAPRKLKKEHQQHNVLSIELKKTKDILYDLGSQNSDAVLVGFALETEHGLRNAKQKLKDKKLDLIVLNNAEEEGAGFETDTNVVTIIAKKGKIEKLRKMSKYDVGHEILNRIVRILSKKT